MTVDSDKQMQKVQNIVIFPPVIYWTWGHRFPPTVPQVYRFFALEKYNLLQQTTY